MEWFPTEADFLTVFGAVLAAGAALLGLATGLNQFSNTARARRLTEWTSEALTSEENRNRRAVLENLKLRGQGHLIAEYLVPWWRFNEIFLWTLTFPLFLTLASLASHISIVIAGFIGNLWLITLAARESIIFYTERIRIKYRFVMGKSNKDLIRTDTPWLRQPKYKRVLMMLSLSFTLSVSITGGSLTWALTADQGTSTWLWIFLVGILIGWQWLTVVRAYAKEWAQE